MCRSCHPTAITERGATDCANCHLPERSPESLFALLPDRSITPRVSFGPGLPRDAREDFARMLGERLSDNLLAVVTEADPLAMPVSIDVRVEVGEGRTDSGVVFHSARGHAQVRLHRVNLEVTGKPASARESEQAVRLALTRLLDPLVTAITF